MSAVGGLVARVKKGEPAAISRALSLIVNEAREAAKLSKAFFPYSGTIQKIGLFGPPGTGKSSLLGRLLAHYRCQGLKLGVLAVDPSSHVSGGAFLGDRLRLRDHSTDSGVFIRSLASRGMVGGLSHTIFGAIHVLEAAGFDRIFIETVGTGQDEVEIARVADTLLYVTTPALGDEIQAMKAGAMEIADCFVVNKADLAGKDKALSDIKSAMGLGLPDKKSAWQAPVVAASAKLSTGIGDLVRVLEDHREYLASGPGRSRLKVQCRQEVALYLSRRIYDKAVSRVTDKLLEEMLSRKLDPATLGERLLKSVKK